MKKRPNEDAPEHLRQLWQAYEYPGQMVLRDIARLGKWFRRTWAALTGSDAPPSKEGNEDHLWAERRE
ncbi:MAG TPA: hypothetical protein VF523_01150 [Burkholderiales bacterium]